ncbi:hypothetical protein A2U01_0040726, partial [Trifolium medium]|nr:hypothetical protein [Trifolium medium]
QDDGSRQRRFIGGGRVSGRRRSCMEDGRSTVLLPWRTWQDGWECVCDSIVFK